MGTYYRLGRAGGFRWFYLPFWALNLTNIVRKCVQCSATPLEVQNDSRKNLSELAILQHTASCRKKNSMNHQHLVGLVYNLRNFLLQKQLKMCPMVVHVPGVPESLPQDSEQEAWTSDVRLLPETNSGRSGSLRGSQSRFCQSWFNSKSRIDCKSTANRH